MEEWPDGQLRPREPYHNDMLKRILLDCFSITPEIIIAMGFCEFTTNTEFLFMKGEHKLYLHLVRVDSTNCVNLTCNESIHSAHHWVDLTKLCGEGRYRDLDRTKWFFHEDEWTQLTSKEVRQKAQHKISSELRNMNNFTDLYLSEDNDSDEENEYYFKVPSDVHSLISAIAERTVDMKLHPDAICDFFHQACDNVKMKRFYDSKE